MPIVDVVRYFINSIAVDGSQQGGVSSVTVSRAANITTLVTKGKPSIVKNWYKKPNATMNYSRFLTQFQYTTINASSMAVAAKPSPKNIEVGIIGGSGLKFNDARITSLTFNFPNEGLFTESVTYEGVSIESMDSSFSEFNDTATESVYALRRKNFKSGASSIPYVINDDMHILSIDVALNISYGTIPTWGQFYTSHSNYISFPMDISCTFEVIDLGGSTTIDDFTEGLGGINTFNDSLAEESIVIATDGPTINLGTKNFLNNIERSGGDAGQNNYSIYKLTYKNTNNYFTVS